MWYIPEINVCVCESEICHFDTSYNLFLLYLSLISLSYQEDTGVAADATNENKEFPDGMADVEVGKRLAEV